MGDILITNATVITMNTERQIIEDGAVKIEGNRIVEIGTTKDLQRRGGAGKVICGAGKAVMPGLVNAHTHLNMIFGRTLAYDNNLQDWLAVQKSLMAALTPEDWELVQMLGCVENIKNGNTCINDMNSAAHDSYKMSVDDICARTFEKTGVRGILSRGYVDDKTYFPGFGESRQDIVNRVERLIKDWHRTANGRIMVQLAPTVPWACSPGLLRETRRLSDKYEIGIHHHTAETPYFNDFVNQRFGYETNIEYLASVGNLGPDVQLAHAVWLSERDLRKIAETCTSVVHNPASNMILASGISNIPKMLELGINVALASDGPACNNNQDMILSMKFASLLHKVNTLNPTALTAQQVMEMATIKSAKAFGMDYDIGSLEQGKKADLITVDLRKCHIVPMLDVIGAIVYSANGSDINDVIIDGELIMENRKINTVDEDEILERAQKAAKNCLRRSQGLARRNRATQ